VNIEFRVAINEMRYISFIYEKQTEVLRIYLLSTCNEQLGVICVNSSLR